MRTEGIQGEDPLMQPVVNGQTVAEVISGWTGIPIGKMVADEINAVLNLAENTCTKTFSARTTLSRRYRSEFERREQDSQTRNGRSAYYSGRNVRRR